jgi:hypothetical protein
MVTRVAILLGYFVTRLTSVPVLTMVAFVTKVLSVAMLSVVARGRRKNFVLRTIFNLKLVLLSITSFNLQFY